MRVQRYDYDSFGNEIKVGGPCDLTDCLPERDEEYYKALGELQRSNRVWVGGGAAPLTLLMRVEEDQ